MSSLSRTSVGSSILLDEGLLKCFTGCFEGRFHRARVEPHGDEPGAAGPGLPEAAPMRGGVAIGVALAFECVHGV